MPVNYEWYQTDQKVVVTVKIKQAAEKNCAVKIESERLIVTGDGDNNLTLELNQKINEAESGFKMTAMKIEVSLKKLIGDRWPALEKTEATADTVPAPPLASLSDTATSSKPGAVPRSHKDWDKVVNQVYTKEDEKV